MQCLDMLRKSISNLFWVNWLNFGRDLSPAFSIFDFMLALEHHPVSAGEKTPIRLGPPDFVKFSTMLFRPEKLISDQIGHGGSIGVNGRS